MTHTPPVDLNPPLDGGEDVPSNPTLTPTIGDIIAERYSRRDVLRGALGTAAIAATVSPLALAMSRPAAAEEAQIATFNFSELAAGSDATHHVAPGYDANILIRWGDKVVAGAPEFDPAHPSADAQAKQFGYNNDFIGFIPIDGRSDHGVLVVNHEYTNDELMYAGIATGKPRLQAIRGVPEPLARASMQAHGGSVLEVKKENGTWRVVEGSRFARRITADTPMQISGPAAGHDWLKTSADPTGTRVLGMINNCAGGVTPWGTWLTCEENINYYFWGTHAVDTHPQKEALKRFKIPEEAYPWGLFEPRFNLALEPFEPNRFGWVVEIDPMDPTSTPIKRTALGRFKHEGAGNIVNGDGRFVVYQGDDQKFEYVYKFVTDGKVDTANRAANKNLLDSGTLYVARFDAQGRGEWLPLVASNPKLAAFKSQAEILIHARLAADALGATRMDRPEDVEANPKTGKVYVNLTNNDKRGTPDNPQADDANPRSTNKFGHIIEITPDGGDHAALGFAWTILVKCGDPSIAAVGATFNAATSNDGWFGMPDNCAIDADGRLWIATDGNSPKETGRGDGLFALETNGALRGTSKLFFRVPAGAEMCGPAFTPDGETLFVAVQHPGESEDKGAPATFETPTTRWPDFKDGMPPRPSVVVITKQGGGKIGV
jgi:uncharacterized protein